VGYGEAEKHIVAKAFRHSRDKKSCLRYLSSRKAQGDIDFLRMAAECESIQGVSGRDGIISYFQIPR